MADSAARKVGKGKEPERKVSKAAGIPYSTAEKFLGAPKSMLTKKQKKLPDFIKSKIIKKKKKKIKK
jgi:hypothetical protein|tara:strand:+ start:304 stop:504 length:201 start_codon:yes stop_codon:yes gene_type:complete